MSHYQLVKTAMGTAALAFAADPFCLLAVRLPAADLEALCRPFDERSWRIDRDHPRARAIADQLAAYFEGSRIQIPWSCMDLTRFSPAQHAVYRTVAQIAYGHTASYGEVAQRAGLPRAARFVGTTMANNPYPVFIPCHRVIKGDGSPGRFGGGEALKVQMLALEAAARANARPA